MGAVNDDLRDDEGLTELERRFVDAYMGEAHGVGAKAMRMASPKSSAGSARQMAAVYLRRPHIREALRNRIEGDELAMGRLERIRRMSRIARGEHVDVRTYRENGKVVRVNVPAKIRDQLTAIEMLARAAGEHLAALPGDESGNDLQRVPLEELMDVLSKMRAR